MTQHQFILSSEGQQLAQEPAIDTALKAIWNDDDYYPAVHPGTEFGDDSQLYTEDLLSSEFFERQNSGQRARIGKALGILGNKDEEQPLWAIESLEITDDCLFPVKKIIRRPKAQNIDGLVLAGASAIDIERLKPGLLDLSSEFGFSTELDFTVFIGAATLSSIHAPHYLRHEAIVGGTSFAHELEPGINRVTTVGADAHGDFRITQHEEYIGGAISPFGDKTAFAPTGKILRAGGYHSIEPGVLLGCLKFMHSIVKPSERAAMIDKIYSTVSLRLNAPQFKPTIAFGDFGESDIGYYISLLNDSLQSPTRATADIQTWAREIAGPASEVDLCLFSRRDELHIGNTADPINVNDETPLITLSLDELPDFIASIIDQANHASGRTDPGSLLQLIQTYAEH